MQTKTLTLLFFLFIGRIFAQNDTSNTNFYTYKNQLGFGVSDLLFNYLKTKPNKSVENYYLIYRRHFQKVNLRAGFSYNYNFYKSTPIPNIIFYDLTSYEKSFNYRLGMDMNIKLSTRFMLNLGMDLMYKNKNTTYYHRDTSNNWASTSFHKGNGFGLSPMCRIEYKINKRLSLSSDAVATMILTKYISHSTYPNKDPDMITYQLYDFDFNFPKTIYLNFSF